MNGEDIISIEKLCLSTLFRSAVEHADKGESSTLVELAASEALEIVHANLHAINEENVEVCKIGSSMAVLVGNLVLIGSPEEMGQIFSPSLLSHRHEEDVSHRHEEDAESPFTAAFQQLLSSTSAASTGSHIRVLRDECWDGLDFLSVVQWLAAYNWIVRTCSDASSNDGSYLVSLFDLVRSRLGAQQAGVFINRPWH